MTPARLAALKFEAEHKGISQHRFDAMMKAGEKLPEHASMIAVTPTEMRELLEAYEEKHSGVQS